MAAIAPKKIDTNHPEYYPIPKKTDKRSIALIFPVRIKKQGVGIKF
ncbi:MAG: hypothetical protein ACRYFB_04390 [Janthinobacterium lividum]